jgi:hypothetical protein
LSHTGDSAQRFKGAKRRAAPKRMVPPGAAKGMRDDGARMPRPDVLTKELQ